MLTTDPTNPKIQRGTMDKNPVPQNEVYLVLSEEEISKGFVRPVRTTYVHVGKKIDLEGGTIRPLTEEEEKRYAKYNYAAFIKYPKSRSPIVGKFLSKEDMDCIDKYVGGCGGTTKMNRTIAETYARDPSFYGLTYCITCQKHLNVDEFVWLGTDEKVGS